MERSFQSKCEELKNDIRNKLHENIELFREENHWHYEITDSEFEFYINSIFARLFILSYGKISDMEEKSNPNDIRINLYQWMKEQFPSNKILNGSANTDLEDSVRSKIRYQIEKRVQYHFGELKILKRPDLIEEQTLEHERGAKYYSRADFELLDDRDDTFRIIDYITTGRIKAIDHSQLAEAFYKIDQYYNNAKAIASAETDTYNMTRYIAKWVNSYRMESKIHITLAEKLVDLFAKNGYKLEKKHNKSGIKIEIVAKDKVLISDLKLDIMNLTLAFGSLQLSDKHLMESWYDIPYYTNIKPYFECTSEEHFLEILKNYVIIRGFLTKTVISLLSSAEEVFKPFKYGVPETIDVMYIFCKETFPIIETHQNSKLYTIKDKSTIKKNEKYIKIATNFMSFFCYENNKIPMKDIADRIQKILSKKHSTRNRGENMSGKLYSSANVPQHK